MAYREPPKDTRSALLTIWHVLIGTNGEGLITRFENLEGKIFTISENMMTKTDFESLKKKRRSKWLAAKDIVLLIIAILGALKTVGVL